MQLCTICGREMKARKGRDGKDGTELEARADHMTIHTPSPAQWTEAYNRIQRSKPGKAEGV